ncbi:MAG: regulatory protein RecX [Dethiobacteria bacterium]
MKEGLPVNNDQDYRNAWNKALRWLAYRQRSKNEMRDYLLRKGFGADTSTNVIRKLEEIGLLDDKEFARLWVEYSYRKLKGSLKIRWELKEKGIDEEIIRDSLKEGLPSEYERASSLMDKYLPPDYQQNDKNLLRKTVSFLKRRGYPNDAIYKIVNNFFK